MKNLSNGLLTVVVVCLIVLGCSAYRDGKPAAEAQIVEFHSLYGERKFSELYSASHEKMKEASTETEFIDFLTAVESKLGKVTNSRQVNWRVQNFNLESFVEIIQDTEFEKGRGTETFTFLIEGKDAILVAYFINSNDLILK